MEFISRVAEFKQTYDARFMYSNRFYPGGTFPVTCCVLSPRDVLFRESERHSSDALCDPAWCVTNVRYIRVHQ